MKWLHFIGPMFTDDAGNVREAEPWISCEEMIADSGKRKGIKLMGMTISVVKGIFIQPKEMLFLHFKNQKPADGIRVGYIRDDNDE
jgi:hypothetical protein